MSEQREPGRGVMCFACGVENDRGLRMDFRREGDRDTAEAAR